MTENAANISALESHYRPCACRSSTPFFSKRQNNLLDNSGHAENRTLYQHDRDKIVYSKAFRRLRLKTQIYPEHTADHLRTRLDHTLEVAQIARHLARQLGLNEDLVDAISLAHDIGHTPFAHSGERALHKYLMTSIPGSSGFKHNWHGLRVVDKIEKAYPNTTGLNLTNAVRIGILKHTKLHYKDKETEDCHCDLDRNQLGFNPESKSTDIFEVQLVRLADEIGQVVHDFEDALVARALSLSDVIKNPTIPLITNCVTKLREKYENDDFRFDNFEEDEKDNRSLIISMIRSELIYDLSVDAVQASKNNLQVWESKHFNEKDPKKQIDEFDKFVSNNNEFVDTIALNKSKSTDFINLKDYLENKLIHSERVSRMDGKADYIISHVLEVFQKSPLQIHESILTNYAEEMRKKSPEEDYENLRLWKEDKLKETVGKDPVFLRHAVDYIAGMTDRFALQEYDQLYSAYPRREI